MSKLTKQFIFALIGFAMIPSLGLAAQIAIEIPVFVEGVNAATAIPVALVNPELQKKGLDPLPEKMVITDSDPFDYWTLDSKVTQTLEKAGYPNGNLVLENVPTMNANGEFHTCYRGDATRLADLVQNLSDGPYSDQLVVQGWKFKDQKAFLNMEYPDDSGEAQTLDRLFAKKSRAWADFDTSSEDVLILTSFSDDGTDLNESLIPLCQ